jgi:hypothetical protein
MARRKKEEEILENEALLDSEEEFSADEENDELEAVSEEDSEELEEMDLDSKSSGTDAVATLAPSSSKAEKMNTLMNAMSGMSGGDMIKFWDMVLAAAKEFPAKIPDGAAAQNKASIDAKGSPVKEDLEALWGDEEELSEEFKDKMSTLFEASVQSRLHVEVARLEEEFENSLKEQVEDLTEDLIEKVDQYLDYVAEEWMEQNKAAVETSLRTTLAEDFIADLGDLCRKYNLDLPEGQDDIVEDLVAKVDELEEKLNETVSKNIEMHEEIKTFEKASLIEKVADTLSPIHTKKFKMLAENVEFGDDEEGFLKKLAYIKEGFFEKAPKAKSTQLISEEIAGEAEESDERAFVDPQVKNVYNAISRTVKR